VNVTQVLCAAGPVDAVTSQALAWREQFRRWGWKGRDFSARMPRGMRRQHVRMLGQLEPREGVVVVHFSGYGQGLERLFDSPARILLLYHNVTPEEWFWPHEPVEAVGCRLGREQLGEFARQADALAGVSEFNAAELRAISGRAAEVIPVLFDPTRLGPPRSENGSGSPSSGGGPTILFVGRLTPHKRQDLVIQAFAEYRRRRPEAKLTLVGHPVSLAYGRGLARLADELAPGGVSFEAGLSAPELAERYLAADVFLCLSEHEGFCIPLLEAFHFGVPVVARDAGAVGEVVGDAGVLLGAEDDVATVAELLDIVSGDAELRQELRARGQSRLELFDASRTAARMRRVLELVWAVAQA
jgi:glycosyltransferase involved in cell wall biosynthesis